MAPRPTRERPSPPLPRAPLPQSGSGGFPRRHAGVGQGGWAWAARSHSHRLARSVARWRVGHAFSARKGERLARPGGERPVRVAGALRRSHATGREVFDFARSRPAASMSRAVRVRTSSPCPTSLSNSRVAAWEAAAPALRERGARQRGRGPLPRWAEIATMAADLRGESPNHPRQRGRSTRSDAPRGTSSKRALPPCARAMWAMSASPTPWPRVPAARVVGAR